MATKLNVLTPQPPKGGVNILDTHLNARKQVYGFYTVRHLMKNAVMKLKLTLLLFCLFGVGIFSHAQDNKKAQSTRPKVESGPDAIPVVVTSSKKAAAKKMAMAKQKSDSVHHTKKKLPLQKPINLNALPPAHEKADPE